MLVNRVFVLSLFLAYSQFVYAQPMAIQPEVHPCDVLILGGSTAALAAALSAADEESNVILTEPTDWIGGQLTSSAVPAIDEAWHQVASSSPEGRTLNVAKLARDPRNMPKAWHRLLLAAKEKKICGDCWVSRFCFLPNAFHDQLLVPLVEKRKDKLELLTQTVVKSIKTTADGKQITEVHLIQRTRKLQDDWNGYDRLPSTDIPDWYSYAQSPRFHKRSIIVRPINKRMIVIDATEWGEALVLSGADYLQGVDRSDGALESDDRQGQAIVFDFAQEIVAKPAQQSLPYFEQSNDNSSFGWGIYHDRHDAWQRIWTYRRLRGDGQPKAGDISLQNWGYDLTLEHGGNDYPFGYLFLDRQHTAQQIANWQGGVNFEVMAGAEQRAYGWHDWFRKQAPSDFNPEQIRLNGKVLGTAHGLAKLPYIRDTRRSIGIDDYLLCFSDMVGPAEQITGTCFSDRIALGAYPKDIHPLVESEAFEYLESAPEKTLPYYIPYRALTNRRIENLLVAGKTMSQSYLANSATRLHPTEWSTGSAAGAAAAYLHRHDLTTAEGAKHIDAIQNLVRTYTPIDWSIPEVESD